MQRANKLYVIGIGYRPLHKRAKGILLGAGAILASSRLLDVFSRYDEYESVRDRIKMINGVPETVGFIKEQLCRTASRPVVLLASGDPLFFGIGRRILEVFGKEVVEILPDLSSVQEAFARINKPWDDAFFVSLHGGPDIAKRRKLPYEAGDIPRLLERYGKLGVLTDRENNPVFIAKVLRSAIVGQTPPASPLGTGGLGEVNSEITIHVCERLGYDDEKITRGTPEEIAGMSFADPNVVIIQKTEDRSRKSDKEPETIKPVFGLKEDEIGHERGLITKDEVRAVTLHKLRLPYTGIFWDIGAGSGSVSIEASRLCPGIKVFAIEKDPERIDTIRSNMLKYNVRNVEIIHGPAPDALADLPNPDRVFIGGSSGNLREIVKLLNQQMMSGIIVANAATLDTLNEALSAFERNAFSAEVSEILVSRSKEVGGKRHMAALNPVFIIKGEKG